MITITIMILLMAALAVLWATNRNRPQQKQTRMLSELAKDSVKRKLRGKPKRGYQHVYAGWRVKT